MSRGVRISGSHCKLFQFDGVRVPRQIRIFVGSQPRGPWEVHATQHYGAPIDEGCFLLVLFFYAEGTSIMGGCMNNLVRICSTSPAGFFPLIVPWDGSPIQGLLSTILPWWWRGFRDALNSRVQPLGWLYPSLK